MDARFAELYRKFLADGCSPDELAEFYRFLRTPGAEDDLRALMRGTYADTLKNSGIAVDTGGRLMDSPETPALMQAVVRRHRVRTGLRAGAGIGGVLLIAAAVWWGVGGQPAANAAKIVAAAPKSVHNPAPLRRVRLPDGTQVWLNVGSRLDYPDRFDATKREVTLTGEAYFDVLHDPAHPFVIHTGGLVTTVLGTAFDINAYPERGEVTVSVTRGKVRISRAGRVLGTLVKGQELRVADADSAQARRKEVNAAEIASWQLGSLIYDDMRLSDVAADLSRIYGVPVLVGGGSLPDMHISTRLRRDEGLDRALEILSKLADAQLHKTNNGFIIQ